MGFLCTAEAAAAKQSFADCLGELRDLPEPLRALLPTRGAVKESPESTKGKTKKKKKKEEEEEEKDEEKDDKDKDDGIDDNEAEEEEIDAAWIAKFREQIDLTPGAGKPTATLKVLNRWNARSISLRATGNRFSPILVIAPLTAPPARVCHACHWSILAGVANSSTLQKYLRS